MSGSVNKVIIIGNLTREPEIRNFQSGDRVASLSVATSERWKDKDTGERKEKSEFHRVSVINQPLVKICEEYLKKGSKVYIEGQLETRKWQDQSGQDKYSTEVVLRPYNGIMVMLDGKEAIQAAKEQGEQTPQQAAPPVDNMEDEIPF